MSSVMRITGALAVLLAAAPGVSAQVTSGQDSGDNNPYPTVRRQPSFDTTTATTADTGVRTTTTRAATGGAVADTVYVRQAMRGHLTEVAFGRLADSRADNDAVEEYGERMVSEHNAMNERWAELARNNGMKADTELGLGDKATIERLGDLEKSEFDQAYMAETIRHHERDLATYQRIASSARSDEVRTLANSEVAAVRGHLAQARQAASQVGVTTTAGRTGGGIARAPDRAIANQRDDRNERGQVRAEDRAFINNVIQDHLMHVRLAQRAQREARNDETKRLAKRMEEDFKEWQALWEEIARRNDVNIPKNLGRLHGQKVDRLEKASRQNVDRVYAQIVADHLASVVPYFEKEGKQVRPGAARQLAQNELPMIREHLQRAQRLEGRSNSRADASNKD